RWAYRKDMYTGLTLSRQYSRIGERPYKTCKFHYEEEGLARIQIIYNGSMLKEEVILGYGENGRISTREINYANGRKMKEIYVYGKTNKLEKKKFEFILKDGAERIFYCSEYEYYKKEDIHDFLN
ncbi:MAG: hypothetical protein AAF696_33995, partial [Bacteroidota bacterium]